MLVSKLSIQDQVAMCSKELKVMRCSQQCSVEKSILNASYIHCMNVNEPATAPVWYKISAIRAAAYEPGCINDCRRSQVN